MARSGGEAGGEAGDEAGVERAGEGNFGDDTGHAMPPPDDPGRFADSRASASVTLGWATPMVS